MNFIYTGEIYNFTKSSTMWAILIGILVLIVVISLIISAVKKNYGIFAGTFAICIIFIFISIMGFLYPISGLDYKHEKEVLEQYNYTYDNFSGAFTNRNNIFYKKGNDNYYLICKNKDNCNAYEITDLLKKAIKIDSMGIENINEIAIKIDNSITIVKDQKIMNIQIKDNSIYYDVTTNKEYLDKDKKEVNDLPDLIEFNLDFELSETDEQILIYNIFNTSIEEFEVSHDNYKLRYEKKVSIN